jgi:hypothetical protein
MTVKIVLLVMASFPLAPDIVCNREDRLELYGLALDQDFFLGH